MRCWEKLLTEVDRKVIEKTGMGTKLEFGRRPALIIVDVIRRSLGSTRQPILQAIEEYPRSSGEAAWIALAGIQQLLESCRANNILVIYTGGDGATRLMYDLHRVKGNRKEDQHEGAMAIPEEIAPLPSELVLRKIMVSAFFGTPLDLLLRAKGVDTLLFTGAITSGCVLHSVVDAFSYGYRCFVVEECTYDNIELSYLASLFIMNARFAEVISLEEALKYVKRPKV